jgi:hypothetical protein
LEVLFALDVAFLEKRRSPCSASHRHQGVRLISKAIAIEKRIDVLFCKSPFFYIVDQISLPESGEEAVLKRNKIDTILHANLQVTIHHRAIL